MKDYIIDNPILELGTAVTELYKMTDMAEIIIDAIFNGDNVTLQNVGSSMEVFLSQLQERLVRVELQKEKLEDCFMWVFRAYRSDISELYEQEYETYLTERKSMGIVPQSSGPYEGAVAFMKLLPNDKKDKIHNALKHTADISHKKGFIEGYKAAVKRCVENGGVGNGGE